MQLYVNSKFQLNAWRKSFFLWVWNVMGGKEKFCKKKNDLWFPIFIIHSNVVMATRQAMGWYCVCERDREWLRVCVCECVWVCIYMFECVCVFVCECVSVCKCVWVCVFVCAYKYLVIHTPCICTWTLKWATVQRNMRARVHGLSDWIHSNELAL